MPKNNKTGADHRTMRPQRSEILQNENTSFNTEIVTLLDEVNYRPMYLIKDPEAIVPHDKIPKKVKNSIIEVFGEDYFHGREWTVLQIKKLTRAIGYPKENLTVSIAQICSPECTIMDNCPYDIMGEAPLGERCPVELKLARLLTDEYNIAVSDRHGIPIEDLEEDIVYHNLIRGLVEADIVENRLNSSIGREGFIQETPTAVNEETGEVYFRKEEAVAVRIKERVNSRRDKIYQQLIASPEMVAKYKLKSDADNITRLIDAVENLEKIVTTNTLPIKDADITKDNEDA